MKVHAGLLLYLFMVLLMERDLGSQFRIACPSAATEADLPSLPHSSAQINRELIVECQSATHLFQAAWIEVEGGWDAVLRGFLQLMVCGSRRRYMVPVPLRASPQGLLCSMCLSANSY